MGEEFAIVLIHEGTAVGTSRGWFEKAGGDDPNRESCNIEMRNRSFRLTVSWWEFCVVELKLLNVSRGEIREGFEFSFAFGTEPRAKIRREASEARQPSLDDSWRRLNGLTDSAAAVLLVNWEAVLWPGR